MKDTKDTKNVWDNTKSFLKSWIIILILVLFIVISIVEFSIIAYMNFEWARLIIKKIVLSSDGSFNWASITAVIALLTFVFNSVYTAKKYKADLISTSRISWMNTTRSLSSEIISNSSKIASKIATLVSNYSNMDYLLSGDKNLKYHSKDQGEQAIKEHNLKLGESISSYRAVLLEKTTLFKMYFGSNIENDKLVNISDEIQDFTDDLIRLLHSYNDGDTTKTAKEIEEELEGKLLTGENLMDRFSDSCRDYYKTEWEKVKLGK